MKTVRIALGAAAAGLLGAVLVPLAAATTAQAFPEPPCIVTGTGQCVPDTVWPIHAGGGPVQHPLPPVEHHPGLPPVSGPPEVITCIVDEGCFTQPAFGGVELGGGGADVPSLADLPAL